MPKGATGAASTPDATGVTRVSSVTSMASVTAETGGTQPGRGDIPLEERARDLAEACVRFVEKAVGVRLDYQADTLPILDHYLEEGRKTLRERPEAMVVIAHTAGVYFGEVVRRRYPSWWRFDNDDPAGWRIELEPVYLSFCPVQLVADALLRVEDEASAAMTARDASAAMTEQDESAAMTAREASAEHDESAQATQDAGDLGAEERFELDEIDREAVGARLADLPAVTAREFYAPSMRLEVIDIAVEAIRARRLADGDEADAALCAEDYEA
jgi:hypothetical protein